MNSLSGPLSTGWSSGRRNGVLARSAHYGALISYSVAIFVGAFLLFAVEPMVAKMVLPEVGGSPAVWNTVVAFFQFVLLAGYCYAHILPSVLPPRKQIATHLVIMLLGLTLLPFHVTLGHRDLTLAPTAAVFLSLLLGVGLPSFIVGSTSPLLQSWFSCIGNRHSKDPYFLYVASNVGSLCGLAAYPILLEANFGVAAQSAFWLFGYVALIALMATAAFWLWTSGSAEVWSRQAILAASPSTLAQRLRWIVLAFVPASLSLAVTTHITSMVAPMPLFWVLPLSLYLLSFIIAFARQNLLSIRHVSRTIPYVVLPVAFLATIQGALPILLDIALNLLTFFIIALAAHMTLAQQRPPADRLTEFYLWIAIGGLGGGLFNAIVAPALFRSIAEYPISLVVACLALPALGVLGGSRRSQISDFALPLALGAAFMVAVTAIDVSASASAGMRKVVFAIALIACFSFVRRRVRFALGLTALFVASSLFPTFSGRVLAQQRNYFGLKTALLDPTRRYHQFAHSGTVHGAQSIDPRRARETLTYYSDQGPLGDVFRSRQGLHLTQHVAVVGLGIGTLACYERRGEHWTYFEIDPQVVHMAKDPSLFTYMSTCAPHARIIVGDGRLELAALSATEKYDLLILDAYSSDQLPTHLITREAMQVYLLHLAPRGVMVFNISNRHFFLAPILANMAASAGMRAWVRGFMPTSAQSKNGLMSCEYVVMARSALEVRPIGSDPNWHDLRPNPRYRLWTDDYSSLLTIMHL